MATSSWACCIILPKGDWGSRQKRMEEMVGANWPPQCYTGPFLTLLSKILLQVNLGFSQIRITYCSVINVHIKIQIWYKLIHLFWGELSSLCWAGLLCFFQSLFRQIWHFCFVASIYFIYPLVHGYLKKKDEKLWYVNQKV